MRFNSVAPDPKRAAANATDAAGGHYVDIAVMAPVHPALNRAPLLVSGPHAAPGVEPAGDHRAQSTPDDGDAGAASAIKMIRSIMIEGLEALTSECLLSAHAAGIETDAIASLDASFTGFDWQGRGDYNLDRILVHGRRPAAEMREAALTARALGQTGWMADATAAWQQRLGDLEIHLVPNGLTEKAEAILHAAGRHHS